MSCFYALLLLLLSLHVIICTTVAVCIVLRTDTSQQMSKAEVGDGGLSPVNSVLVCFVVYSELVNQYVPGCPVISRATGANISSSIK